VELERAAVVRTYLLAAGVFLNAILVTGVAAILSIPDVFAETGALPSLPSDNRSLPVLLLTCLSLALGLAVIARAAEGIENSDAAFGVSREHLIETLDAIREEEAKGVERVTQLMETR